MKKLNGGLAAVENEWKKCKARILKGAENYHINLIIMIFTAVNNYNYAKLLNNYCLLAINRNIMSFATLVNCSLVVVVVIFSLLLLPLLFPLSSSSVLGMTTMEVASSSMITLIICRDSHFCIRNR